MRPGLVVLASALMVWASAGHAQQPPLPRKKPPAAAPVVPVAPPADGAAANAAADRAPQALRDDPAVVAPDVGGSAPAYTASRSGRLPVPRNRPETPDAAARPEATARQRPVESRDPGTRFCSELPGLGVVFETVEAIADAGGCGIAAPIEVRRLGSVSLTPSATMNCLQALALARWAADVEKAARLLPDDAVLTAIRQNSGYVCRRRNNAARGRMSEHAFGNAIDIAGFEFRSSEAIVVAPHRGDDVEARFLTRVRKAACEHFTTVLGPGSNAAHADHFHFDMRQRRRGYRLCEP